MKKFLVLVTNKKMYYFGNIRSDSIDVREVFKEEGSQFYNFLVKAVRRFYPGFLRYFYDDWCENLEQYNKIIMMDDIRHRAKDLPLDILEDIKRNNIEGYIYSWNVIKSESAEKWIMNMKKVYPVYHYDIGMCQKYGLRFNTIMYPKNLSISTKPPMYDAIFLGYAKDREDSLIQIYEQLTAAGMKLRFCVLEGSKQTPYAGFEYLDKYVSYFAYLEMVAECSAIVDVAQSGQDGYSMRVMEAIFLDKKLISTNSALRKAEFYSSDNILIIDEMTSIDAIKRFLQTETQYDEQWKEHYSFERWADRFHKE